jgi:hypothetical protein
MDHALIVNVLEAKQGLPCIFTRPTHRKRPFGGDHPRQVEPGNEFHHEVQGPVIDPGVVGVNHILVIQPRGEQKFPAESSADGGAVSSVESDKFQCDDSVESGVSGKENAPHPTCPEPFEQNVTPDHEVVPAVPADLNRLEGGQPSPPHKVGEERTGIRCQAFEPGCFGNLPGGENPEAGHQVGEGVCLVHTSKTTPAAEWFLRIP